MEKKKKAGKEKNRGKEKERGSRENNLQPPIPP